MCYEESFLQRWARKRAQRRRNVKQAAERDRPKQPIQSAPAPATAGSRKKATETERDVELV